MFKVHRLPQAIVSRNEQELINEMQRLYTVARDLYVDGVLRLDPLGPRTTSGVLVETRHQFTRTDMSFASEVPYRLISIWGAVALHYADHNEDDAFSASARFRTLIRHDELVRANNMHGTFYGIKTVGPIAFPQADLAAFEPVNRQDVLNSWYHTQNTAASRGFIGITPRQLPAH